MYFYTADLICDFRARVILLTQFVGHRPNFLIGRREVRTLIMCVGTGGDRHVVAHGDQSNKDALLFEGLDELDLFLTRVGKILREKTMVTKAEFDFFVALCLGHL